MRTPAIHKRGQEPDRLVAYRAVGAVVTGDISTVERIYPDSVVLHDPLVGTSEGLVAVRELALLFAGALWHAEVALRYCAADDGQVTVRWSAHGTLIGPLLETAPTRRPALVEGLSVLRVGGGRVEEQWNTYLGVYSSFHHAPVMTTRA